MVYVQSVTFFLTLTLILPFLSLIEEKCGGLKCNGDIENENWFDGIYQLTYNVWTIWSVLYGKNVDWFDHEDRLLTGIKNVIMVFNLLVVQHFRIIWIIFLYRNIRGSQIAKLNCVSTVHLFCSKLDFCLRNSYWGTINYITNYKTLPHNQQQQIESIWKPETSSSISRLWSKQFKVSK